MPENGQEIPSLTREFLQHAEERFNEAPVNRITFDTAKEYSNNHSQWTSVKYHLNSAVCGSEMNRRREDSRVSKDQLSTTINFKAGNIQISRSSSTDLNKDPSLGKALNTGILMDSSYVQTIESTLDEVPEKRFPILRDPTLLRAAQLADLDLL